MKKKLTAIDELIEWQKSGHELDAQQLMKVETLDNVMAEMERLMSEDQS